MNTTTDTTTVWDLILDADAIDLENITRTSVPFESDAFMFTDDTTGERFAIGTAYEGVEPAGYGWTEYDDEWDVSVTNTGGTDDPEVARRALCDWIAAHTTA